MYACMWCTDCAVIERAGLCLHWGVVHKNAISDLIVFGGQGPHLFYSISASALSCGVVVPYCIKIHSCT